MSSKTLFLVCLLSAYVNISSLFKIDDDLINDVIAEANDEIEQQILLTQTKSGFDLASIPGHSTFINSEG